MIIEEWKQVVGFEGIYEVSNLGRIRTCEGKITTSLRHGIRHWKQRILKQKKCSDKRGRIDARVTLYKSKQVYTFLVSRLVAMAWCDGYRSEMTVNHKDGNPLNNNAENLEWVSRGDNIRHGFENDLYTTQKPCALLDKKGGIAFYKSQAEASRCLGRNNGYISCVVSRAKKITDVNGCEYEFIVCA